MQKGIKKVLVAGLLNAIPIGLKIGLQVLIGSMNFFRCNHVLESLFGVSEPVRDYGL